MKLGTVQFTCPNCTKKHTRNVYGDEEQIVMFECTTCYNVMTLRFLPQVKVHVYEAIKPLEDLWADFIWFLINDGYGDDSGLEPEERMTEPLNGVSLIAIRDDFIKFARGGFSHD